ncbi:MAG: ATP-dependent RecD-like DNA helicase [Bacilli bacterium]|nr:ATP-dependent RecD-like DNA helicase [Bacilli bacterium]
MDQKVSGIIQKVIYKNEENSYAVVSLKIDYSDKEMKEIQDILITNLLIVTCYYDRLPVKDEEYSYIGEFVDTKYGLQFKAKSFIRNNIDSMTGIVTYLSSDYFPGIGKATALKIYEALGNSAFDKIRKDKKVLDKIDGLTEEQKKTIYDNLISNEEKEQITLSFVQMGFTMQMAKKIQASLTQKEASMAIKNPYYLIEKIEGIGFIRADMIAKNIGIKEDDPMRIKAAILYTVNRYSYSSGNSYIEKEYLTSEVLKILNKDKEIVENTTCLEMLDELAMDGKIVVDEKDNVYDITIHHAEEKLATNIVSRIKASPFNTFSDEEITKALDDVKKFNNIIYSPLQEKAIITALKENIMIITGGPGTGKTTIVKGIIDAYARLYKADFVLDDVALLAPTGRAGKRLNEVTCHPAQTIHKFLGYDGKRFNYGENNLVSVKMVIIDEMSMVDVVVASRLFQALPVDAKVIMVGDVDQIPSVGPGEVLADIIKTKEITTIKLTEIHRQAKDSTIISLAHSINNGLIPNNILEKQHDRVFLYMKENNVIQSIVNIIEMYLEKGYRLLEDIQVLIPMYKGEIGIDNVNKVLQERFNPLKEEDREFVFYKQRFRINDKVIQLVNRNEDQIMNGDIGYVAAFMYTENEITGLAVQFESNYVEYSKEEVEELMLAYAISIHKSQGSEFDVVIIPFSISYRIMLQRRLYYTAVTRAKKYLIMLGDIEPFKKAVNSIGFRRKTRLEELIKKGMGKKEVSPYDFM